MDNLKYLYFSSASGIFAFGIVPLLWIGSLFVARINRPQIIKSVLFLLMYGHFILYSIISLTIIDAEKSAENTLLVLLEPIYVFLLFLAPVLWLVLFFWSIGELIWMIRRKFKSEKAQKLKEDFAASGAGMYIRPDLPLSLLWLHRSKRRKPYISFCRLVQIQGHRPGAAVLCK